MARAKKIAVIYATYDGAVNSATGVGVVTQYFFESFNAIRKDFIEDGELSLHVLAVRLNEEVQGYQQRILARTKKITKESGGSLHLLNNGTNGEWGYGHPHNWRTVSEQAAKHIEGIRKKYDRTIVFLVDTPFLGTPYYSAQLNSNADIQYILVPHSDVFSHFEKEFSFERLCWESGAFKLLSIYPQVRLAKTSEHLLQILRENHVISKNKIIPLQTGLFLQDKKFQTPSETEIKHALQLHGIPLDKKLIFSVGRAVPYKGFEDLIATFAVVHKRHPETHLVFVAAPYKKKDDPSNVETLRALLKEYDLYNACTPIFALDMELPRYIYAWENTSIVAQLASREPFGLVPEEVRYLAQKCGPIVIANNAGGYIEQIAHGKDGFLVNAADHRETAEVIAHILRLEDPAVQAIRNAGYARVCKNYDYSKELAATLSTLLGQI